jgi:hypothetical protein
MTDIVDGGSTSCKGVIPYPGWNATECRDPVTGLGTPNFRRMLASLSASDMLAASGQVCYAFTSQYHPSKPGFIGLGALYRFGELRLQTLHRMLLQSDQISIIIVNICNFSVSRNQIQIFLAHSALQGGRSLRLSEELPDTYDSCF